MTTKRIYLAHIRIDTAILVEATSNVTTKQRRRRNQRSAHADADVDRRETIGVALRVMT